MTGFEIRQKYLKFFEEKGHKIVPSSSLVPENDPTTLFTGSGMQPMIPYLLGETHPEGKRLVDSQKCFRSQDIEEVGDNRHTTFFEMLGNWSLGDYWKKDQLNWLFEFLTEQLKLDPQKLYVTTFIGDPNKNIPKDTESSQIWKELFLQKGIEARELEIGSEQDGYNKGMGEGKIFFYDAKKNWWSRCGTPDNMPAGEPGGPDSEVFYDFGTPHDEKYGKNCHPNCDCGRFVEIGNSVFMQYQKQPDGSFKELPQKNVDFGGGLERLLMAENNEPDMFRLDLHRSIIERIAERTGRDYGEDEKVTIAMRVVADHVKASVFLIKDGVLPGNKLQGYILRRLLRRAAVKMNFLKEDSMDLLSKLVDPVLDIYHDTDYFQTGDWDQIRVVIEDEINKFQKSLNKGLREVEKIDHIDGKKAFDLYQTYGFPLEITVELFEEKGQEVNLKEFEEEFEKHKQLSQTASKGMFKGGLADHTEETTKLHTATHLMYRALRNVLGNHIIQHGSNITPERLRFDFSHFTKLTEEEIKKVEEIVNEQIQKDLPITYEIVDRDEALKSDVLGAFGDRYPEKVKVYTVEGFSSEICGGPHVEHTGVLQRFKIDKEESASAGIRRIYASLSAI